MKSKDNRPKYLNLFKIHLPITGIASINHRLSGLILFLFIPVSLYLFQLSLSGDAGFNQALLFLSSPWIKLGLVLLTWSFIHHLFAGFRFLLIDQNIGVSLSVARKSAWFVVFTAVIATLIISGVWIL
ncbi:MAG: succinate dehydrogenase, cytochrome b556 subunit [Gammaproteobacteria bacterium]|nr:succinate dehydrogenase, cytochrome b556 subunit [Gammaproteobacteria bacterium]MCW8988849.1 succinate dehydrogenase, cytochrome b556 subunit [Gammaproteobacteria bacterium]MCW9031996.1 succinate dehydrogenase, cytochrome b556 subunit [Gammaproteobacteria bacterium]